MYRFATVAILLAASASTLADLDSGRYRKSSDRVKEVCDSVYKEIRARERVSPLGSDEFARQLLLAIASANNPEHDSGVRVIDLSNLDKYKMKDESEMSNSLFARRGRFRSPGHVGGRGGGRGDGRGRPHHTSTNKIPWVRDIDVSVVTGAGGDRDDDAPPMMRFLDSDDRDSVAASSRSASSGVKQTHKLNDSPAKTEAKTTDTPNAESTDGTTVVPDHKRPLSKPRKIKRLHDGNRHPYHLIQKTTRSGHKQAWWGGKKLSKEHAKLATTTVRSSAAIDTTISDESLNDKLKKGNRLSSSLSDAATKYDDVDDVLNDDDNDEAESTKKDVKGTDDGEKNESPGVSKKPSSLKTRPTRRGSNGNSNVNSNVNRNVNTNINTNLNANKVYREMRGSDEVRGISGNNRRSATGGSPQRHKYGNKNENSNTNVNSYGSADRDDDYETPNARQRSPSRRALDDPVDDDADLGNGNSNSNTNANINSNVMSLAPKPKHRRYKPAKRSTTRRPISRRESIVQSLV